jgi:hypothetical protein
MIDLGLRTRVSSPRIEAAVTIKDVAARAGVSTATVSRVLAQGIALLIRPAPLDSNEFREHL